MAVSFVRTHPGWTALISLTVIGGVLYGLNRAFKLERGYLAPLREKHEILRSNVRWNPKTKRWQDERGHFVKGRAPPTDRLARRAA